MPRDLEQEWSGSAAPALAPDAAREPAIDPAVVDSLRRLGERSGRDVLGELTALFLHTADAQVAQAQELVERSELAELARVAHALKGSGSVIGGRRVASAAAALELACRPSDQSPGDVRAARTALDRFVAELEAFRDAVLRTEPLHTEPRH